MIAENQEESKMLVALFAHCFSDSLVENCFAKEKQDAKSIHNSSGVNLRQLEPNKEAVVNCYGA